MRRLRLVGLIVTAAAVVVAAAVFARTSRSHPPAKSPPPSTAALILDGTYKIGADIKAGRWHTDGPRAVNAYGVDAKPQCSFRVGWPVVKNGVHTVDEIVRKDNSGPADVVLGPEGAVFETKGCRAWRPVSS